MQKHTLFIALAALLLAGFAAPAVSFDSAFAADAPAAAQKQAKTVAQKAYKDKIGNVIAVKTFDNGALSAKLNAEPEVWGNDAYALLKAHGIELQLSDKGVILSENLSAGVTAMAPATGGASALSASQGLSNALSSGSLAAPSFSGGTGNGGAISSPVNGTSVSK